MAKEGNQINAKFTLPKDYKASEFSNSRFKHRGSNQQLTFDTICKWIRMQGLDEYTTDGLIDLAATYPTSALPSFRRNFNLMLARVRQKRRDEQRGLVVEEIKEIEDVKEVLIDEELLDDTTEV
jgi:hypothetical protein